MEKDNIGLNATQVKDGMELYYYSWFDNKTGSHSGGLLASVKGEVFHNSNGYCCFISAISGYVLISHLSKEYYPERYVKPNNSKKAYEEYLHADCFNNFEEFLGVVKPIIERDVYGLYRYKSIKYPNLRLHTWFGTKKAAKKDYKEKLRAYLKSIKK